MTNQYLGTLPALGQRLSSSAPGATGGVRTTLQVEGLALFVTAVALFVHFGYSGMLFAALFLVPDLSLLGYLAGPRLGALVYNTAHAMLGPLLLGVVAMSRLPATLPFALIWAAHVGFDRALGYGLKYAAGFEQTHLGRVGRKLRRT